MDADAMKLSLQDASPDLPPFARQHHGVCNPLDDEKELAKLLRAVLGDAAEDGAGRQRAGGKPPPVSNIPIRVPTHFMGRDDALAAIDAAFRDGGGRLAVAITALHGL